MSETRARNWELFTGRFRADPVSDHRPAVTNEARARALLYLRRCGMSFKEIALAMDYKNANTAFVQHYRAKKKYGETHDHHDSTT